MNKLWWITFLAIPVCLVSVLAVGAGTTHAVNTNGVIDPTCVSSSPCIEYDNNGSGPGVRGIGLTGNGLAGSTKNNSTSAANGVIGNDISTSGTSNSGVRGLSVRGTGVYALSTSGPGIFGASASGIGIIANTNAALKPAFYAKNFTSGSTGVAIQGVAPGNAIIGQSAQGNGVSGQTTFSGSTNGVVAGVLGQDLTSTQQYGVEGTSTNGIGVQGKSQNLFGASGISNVGLGIQGISGTGIGVSAENNSSSLPALYAQTTGVGPEIIANNGSFDVMSLDSSGNMILYGSLTEFSAPLVVTRTTSGEKVGTYSPTEAEPTIEDAGEGQLIEGQAFIALDPSFVKTIDQTRMYLVFITPQGDSNGVYVTQKSTHGFIVKENRGGRSTLAFDYRIVAKPYNHAEPRLPVLRRGLGATQTFAPLRLQEAIVRGLARAILIRKPLIKAH